MIKKAEILFFSLHTKGVIMSFNLQNDKKNKLSNNKIPKIHIKKFDVSSLVLNKKYTNLLIQQWLKRTGT